MYDAERDEMVALTLVLRCARPWTCWRSAGFEVWALSTGDEERVLGYFKKAGVEFPKSNFRSCDARVAKPALDAYRPLFESFGEDEKWFACGA